MFFFFWNSFESREIKILAKTLARMCDLLFCYSAKLPFFFFCSYKSFEILICCLWDTNKIEKTGKCIFFNRVEQKKCKRNKLKNSLNLKIIILEVHFLLLDSIQGGYLKFQFRGQCTSKPYRALRNHRECFQNKQIYHNSTTFIMIIVRHIEIHADDD